MDHQLTATQSCLYLPRCKGQGSKVEKVFVQCHLAPDMKRAMDLKQCWHRYCSSSYVCLTDLSKCAHACFNNMVSPIYRMLLYLPECRHPPARQSQAPAALVPGYSCSKPHPCITATEAVADAAALGGVGVAWPAQLPLLVLPAPVASVWHCLSLPELQQLFVPSQHLVLRRMCCSK